MAAVESFVTDPTSRFGRHHTAMMAGPGNQLSSTAEAQYRQRSRSRADSAQSPSSRSGSQQQAPVGATPPSSTSTRASWMGKQEDGVSGKDAVVGAKKEEPPRSSRVGGESSKSTFSSQKSIPAFGSESKNEPVEPVEPTLKPAAIPISPPGSSSSLGRPTRSLGDLKKHEGDTIKVRDLQHIQEFASEEHFSLHRRTGEDSTMKYEISAMPITDIIEMVAGLLTKITTTNDRQHDTLHRSSPLAGDTPNLSAISTSVLAFHGKNVPSITIMSYLSRIHKYCPTTYEVFLSLLVYFDRMTERVNATPLQTIRSNDDPAIPDTDVDSRPSTSYSAEGSDLADSPPASNNEPEEEEASKDTEMTTPALPLSHFFVVDSFNIHRLVIAGVTCASKFFSDVYYTNSRYAKVGGLPLAELNHLELQFLLLNDFRLSIPVEELEAYGTMLVEFYAREVVAQRMGGGEVVHD